MRDARRKRKAPHLSRGYIDADNLSGFAITHLGGAEDGRDFRARVVEMIAADVTGRSQHEMQVLLLTQADCV